MPVANPGNPFSSPISSTREQIKEIKWTLPYLQSIVATFAGIAVFVFLCVLYPTLGVVIQVARLFLNLASDSYRRMQEVKDFELIGYAVAIGFFLACSAPFLLAALPFLGAALVARWFYKGIVGRVGTGREQS
jgi:hypothetical protein